MKHSRRALIKTGILSFFTVIGLNFTSRSIASNDEIIATFDRYRNALLNTDPNAAYGSIDSNTKTYYKNILNTVLYGKVEEVKQMSFLDKVFIVRSRHQIPKEELTAFNPETYFK